LHEKSKIGIKKKKVGKNLPKNRKKRKVEAGVPPKMKGEVAKSIEKTP